MCRRIISYFGMLMIGISRLIAQDANYWSSSYGPGGFFTPGAVLSYNLDSGVLFYNPALLAKLRKSSVSINGSIYQYEKTKINNAIGTNLDLKGGWGSIIPQMVTNTISFETKKRPITIAYALLNDPVINFEASQRRDTKYNALNDSYSPGDEYFVAQYNIQNVVTETSGLLAVGFPLTKKLSFGLVMEARIHKQTYSVDYSSRAIFNTSTDTLYPPIASTQETYIVVSTSYGLRFKGGLAYDINEHHHLGLLITSPLINISGTATLLSDAEADNILLEPGQPFNLLATTRQTGLKPTWKIPLSIGFGYTYTYDRGQLYFATEFFPAIKQYNVITPKNDYFIRPDTINNSATSEILKMIDAHKPVINFALGYSRWLSERFTGFISLRTDFNYADKSLYGDNKSYIPNTANWNLYHCQLGVNMKQKKYNMRVGTLLSYGSTKHYLQQVNYDDPNESNFLLGTPGETKASRFSIGLMVSIVHNLY